MKNNTLLIVALLLTIAAFFVIYHFDTPTNIDKIDTIIQRDTIRHVDTVEIIKPVPEIIKVIKIDTVFSEKGDTIELIKTSKKYKDTITTCAKDTMEVTSYISGYDATLDSLKVKLSKQEIIKTVEITKYITPQKKFIDHFKIGIGIGYGIGLNSKNFEPFVGVSLNYNF